ncbi:hypothetical protein ITJ58_11720 [Curtobacterium flaccumfaciens]|uniref:hypothetical protein n=1 Tax=Curtobacterium flaccumfaciens TaxID=2035 RepID=UPI00188C542D|nr:hypothetical protein [Curtobacterium flaccumfaciens]MBF4594419.1 hypothetical protein [Curtobacterium flaccumfaciens]
MNFLKPGGRLRHGLTDQLPPDDQADHLLGLSDHGVLTTLTHSWEAQESGLSALQVLNAYPCTDDDVE